MDDLKSFINIRQNRYKVKDSLTAKFLSLPTGPNGKVGRLTVHSAQKMLDRYADLAPKEASES